MAFEQGARCLEFFDYLLCSQSLTSKASKRATIAARMQTFSNLVSDSSLVQETIDLLIDAGGRAAASESVHPRFKISHITDELVGLLRSHLVKNYPPFTLSVNHTLTFHHN